MFRTMVIAALAAVSLVTGSACKQQEAAPPAASDLNKDLAATRQDLAQARVDFRRVLDERIAKLEARIEELDRRGDAKSREAAAAFRARRDEAKATLAQLADRTDSNWDAFKTDMSNRWEQLEKDVDAAMK